MKHLIGLTAALLIGLALGTSLAEARVARSRRSTYELRDRLSLWN